MKHISNTRLKTPGITLLCFLMLAALTVACSSDGTDETGGQTQPAGKERVRVGLRITAAGGSSQTRAWQDGANAVDEEMMNLWTVVVVDASTNRVKAIHACKPTGDARPEVDDYVEMETGTYRFYSFANMAPSVVMQLLGIGGTGAKGSTVTRADGDNGPVAGGNNNVSDYTPANTDDIATTGENDIVYQISFTDGAEVTEAVANAVTVNMAGNGFDPTATSNGYGSKGIPMSNVQTKTITSSTTFDLIVVRMMAKIELQITNETGAAVTLNRVTLSNVTQNGNNILKLLPTLTQHDTMEPTHQDIRPNLGTATQDNFTRAVNKTIAGNATETVAFYVNESATPSNAEGLFYLTLEMDNSGTPEYRYALISDNSANEWNYIARNDYRIIPVTLDDLKFEIIPYDFPPIGVYPVSVKEVDAARHVYDFEFHDYGHFHLLPSVTKGGTPVAFSATTPTGTGYRWTLIDNDFAKSFFTYAAIGDDAQTDNPGSIYRTGTGSTTTDGDDEGQKPAWYVNDGVAGPQWDPAASSNYRPFIFGYIADPGSATKKQAYHEMKIQVYNGTTAYRQMLYRFYMTLSADQMLYAPGYMAAPRMSHNGGL